MRKFLSIPLPMAGLMLAFFALANLLKSYGEVYYLSLSFVGIILFNLLLIKMILAPKELMEGLKHPVVSSVLPTFTMGMMLMSAFLKQYADFSFLWYIAIALHIGLMINFSYHQLLKPNLQKIFPSIFIVFVGIVVASVTGPAYNIKLGSMAFYFGFISYIILFGIIVFRLIKYPVIPDPVKPTLVILAAPSSLCLAGYVSSFSNPSKDFIWILLSISLVMTLYTLIKLPKLLRLPFSPAYSAFTFPLVISAIAIKKANMVLQINWVNTIVQLETIIACLIVGYVFIHYSMFILEIKESRKTSNDLSQSSAL